MKRFCVEEKLHHKYTYTNIKISVAIDENK